MIQLHSIKENLSWQLVLFVLLYLVAVVVFFTVFMPARSENARLQESLAQLERTEQNLLRIVETKPALEATEREMQERLLDLGRLIPSQYDLPEVLAVIDKVSTKAVLKIDSLEHVPLQTSSGSTSGMIPLRFTLLGSEAVYACILQMGEVLPSLRITEVALSYLGENEFQADLRAELQVSFLERATASNWETPELTALQPLAVHNSNFGVSFEVLAQFFEPNVRVLGVVEAGLGSSVLLSKDGKQSWYQVGDRFGEAVVSNIIGNAVWLNVDDVQLKLQVGS